MVAKTKSELFALIGTNLPDNTTGVITPEDLREVTSQIADSMMYAAAGVKEVEVLRAAPEPQRRLLDVQWRTDHLATLGVVSIPRRVYLRRLAAALTLPPAF